MNKLLLSGLILALSGCYPIHYVFHGDATVSIKNGIPCFSYADADWSDRNRIHIRVVSVIDVEKQRGIWGFRKDIILQSLDQCIPYTGEEELKKDTMYGVEFYSYVEGGGG